MTAEEKRIAIAEECGWKIIRQRYSPSSTNDMWALVKDGRCFSSGARCMADEPDIFTLNDYVARFKEKNLLPDYLNDLNAMREAVLTLKSPVQKQTFEWHLSDALQDDSWAVINATAAQGAEAFLKTIGKWNDA